VSSTETHTMPGYVSDEDGPLARLRRIEGWVPMGPTIRDGRADQLDERGGIVAQCVEQGHRCRDEPDLRVR
jgi:hypothetical protein